jgi:hypothetical protein
VTLRRKAGIMLRALRTEARVTPQQAADRIFCHPSKISRMERGEAPLREREVLALLDLYGLVADAEREALLAGVRATGRAAWWHPYQDAVPAWARAYLGMEAEASEVRCYAPYAIPDLLQAPAYAEALTSRSRPGPAAGTLRELRAARQELIRDPARSLQVVIDESALLRAAGGPDVLRDQAAYLIQAAKEPRISIRVLRLSAGAHRDAATPFTLLRFADPALPDVAYIQTPTTGLYLDKPDDVDVYRELVTMLELIAEPAAATPGILAGLL